MQSRILGVFAFEMQPPVGTASSEHSYSPVKGLAL